MRILNVAALLCVISSTASAQLPTDEYRGITESGLLLRKLATTASVLVIGAHPDDEDNQLLSYLSLGHGASVAYLSLTRGEGGQNSIGGELGPALGVLRTSELLSARKVDRSDQYFTRAYDFGFSKTAEETFKHWPRDSILKDVVAVVRRVRPDVIVAIFSGTPRDGHGQHQVSGILAREAFVAAADPARFPEQIRAGLRAHRAFKLVQATGYRQAEPTQRFNTGELDVLFGRSYAQLASVSRSRHRSQDMGQAEALGPRSTSIRVIESRVPVGDSTIFAGIDTLLSSRAAVAREDASVRLVLERYDSAVARAKRELSAYSSSSAADEIGPTYRELVGVIDGIKDAELRFAVERKVAQLAPAILQLSGIVIDAVTDVERIVPGSSITMDVTVWSAEGANVLKLEPLLPAGWHAERVDSAARTDTAMHNLDDGELLTRRFRVRVPRDAVIAQPYFLARPRPGDYYAWPSADSVAGLPFQHAALRAVAVVGQRAAVVEHVVRATRRIVDPRQGELRRMPYVAPAFAMRAEPATLVITLASLASGSRKSIEAVAEVLSNGSGGTVTVRPQLPAGWSAAPAQAALVLSGRGQTGSAKFAITPRRGVAAGTYEIRFSATDSTGRTYDLTQRVVDYAHVTNRVLYEPAVQHVTVLDAKFVRGMRIGYVVGVDPQVPQVLEQMGVLVERLSPPALAHADLGIYDAVVIGSRAYEVRPDLVANNRRVLDYGRKGGNVIVLYQQYEFIQGKFAPYDLTLARPHTRITDENAPVTMLDPAAPLFSRPNRLTARDFENWVQERALYMPNTWAAEYQPMLELSDPGEAAQRGAILVAPLGRGLYTYTGIAFFRQIPAGVPGALRLFINLLSQGIKDAAF